MGVDTVITVNAPWLPLGQTLIYSLEPFKSVNGRKTMSCFYSVVLVGSLAFASSAALAQTGAMQGTITDAAGASVPKAKVTAVEDVNEVDARQADTSPH